MRTFRGRLTGAIPLKLVSGSEEDSVYLRLSPQPSLPQKDSQNAPGVSVGDCIRSDMHVNTMVTVAEGPFFKCEAETVSLRN